MRESGEGVVGQAGGPVIDEFDQRVFRRRAPASDQARDQRRVNCAIARSTREETLARIGLKRTYDLLQHLDEMVREACKGET